MPRRAGRAAVLIGPPARKATGVKGRVAALYYP